MTDRDRLIELLKKCIEENVGVNDPNVSFEVDYENIADYLLANGVILPPCKIGNTLWWIDNKRVLDMVCVGFVKTHKKFLVTIARNTNDFTTHYNAIFNKEVFLTKEEAEKALAERGADND